MKIIEFLYNFEHPKRRALSARFKYLSKPIISTRIYFRLFGNFFNFKIRHSVSKDFFPCVIARHQSVLRRKLGDSDKRLQEQKIINLSKAISRLNGVIISSGDIFSFWDIVGKPSYSKGYVHGMILTNGQVVEGLGGGLCQLSNFLYWIFLHAPFEVVERYHHSLDVFPDSGRILPFGSGATVLYNFIDLKVKNISQESIQLKLWLTDNHLKGQLLSPVRLGGKYHVFEKNHYFIKRFDKYFRYNEIWRELKIENKVVEKKLVTINFAPVLYGVNRTDFIDFTNK